MNVSPRLCQHHKFAFGRSASVGRKVGNAVMSRVCSILARRNHPLQLDLLAENPLFKTNSKNRGLQYYSTWWDLQYLLAMTSENHLQENWRRPELHAKTSTNKYIFWNEKSKTGLVIKIVFRINTLPGCRKLLIPTSTSQPTLPKFHWQSQPSKRQTQTPLKIIHEILP